MCAFSLLCKKSFKETAEITQSIFTIFAIFCGGFWTYMLFNPERDINPHLEIQQNVSSDLAIKDHVNLLQVSIELSNKGNTRLLLDKGYVNVEQVKPLTDCIDKKRCASEQIKDALNTAYPKGEGFSWPLLAKRMIETKLDIEPGETDYIDVEFVIPSEVKAIRVYTFLRNNKKSDETSKEFGWWSKSEIYIFKLRQ